ncbi:MAG: hypothetical protein IJO63_05435 [Bacilli bacterium]|nr:hypothetical protein [Bacilli bacterium]
MKRKTIVDLVTAVALIIVGSLVLTFPLLKVVNVKYIFIGVLAFYGIMNLIQFILTSKAKDYEGLFTMIASIITLILLGFLEVDNNPLNLALTLFVWIVLMSLIKLKKCDYYHDANRPIWIFRIVTLILFVLIGLLSVINLYYEAEVQILVLGFFYFVHGVLELVDPVTNYLLDKK